jgi:SAM-dependent methyltransferase
VNRRFYRERALEFSRSRESPWSGWIAILNRAGALLPETPRILDVGCGNGRFARFLEERLGRAFVYCGIDESSLALDEARKRLPARASLVLAEHDFLRSSAPVPASLSVRTFDFIALFGVLHHVPGRANRLALLGRLAALLAPKGLLAFSLWRFDQSARLRKKIVPWEEFRARTGVEVEISDLEPGDHILTWGGARPAFRFCHAVSEEEEEEIARSLPLDRLFHFDGGREPNRYFVFRYPQRA